MELIRSGTKIPFTHYRKIAIILSTLVNVVVLAFLFFKGPTMGVDFAGGTIVQLKFQQKTTIPDIRQSLGDNPTGRQHDSRFRPGRRQRISRPRGKGRGGSAALGDQMKKGLGAKFGADKFEIRRIEYVGPKIGEDLRWRGTGRSSLRR